MPRQSSFELETKQGLLAKVPRSSSMPEPPLKAPTPQPPDAGVLLALGCPSPPALPDDWEIDIAQLQIYAKIASGAFSNLYKGSYCGQEVAVKILKDVSDSKMLRFKQEVLIMRKVRHKNVVQFIGACTRKPHLCIVFEYVSGGSVCDMMLKEGPLTLPVVLKVAVEVARGMDYLHQRKIIHRDIKSANLLMDETRVVKIADFGIARVLLDTQVGRMTAECGTYRWMAPEVIEHKPYDEKADVYSFAIVLWELLTCKVPYSELTALQAVLGVVQQGLRPTIPPDCPPALRSIMAACWDANPKVRPSFGELAAQLQPMHDAAREEEERRAASAVLAAAKAAAKAESGGCCWPFFRRRGEPYGT